MKEPSPWEDRVGALLACCTVITLIIASLLVAGLIKACDSAGWRL